MINQSLRNQKMTRINSSLITLFFIALLLVLGTACSTDTNTSRQTSERGETGLPGKDGKDGIDGKDGVDGKDGIDGRDGIDGAAGKDGMDGNDGRDGRDGRDGNANVISSGWISYEQANWSATTEEYGITFRNYPIKVPELTQDIVDSGIVMVYHRFPKSSGFTFILPFRDNISSGLGQAMSFRMDVTKLTIKMSNIGGRGDPGTMGEGQGEFRYVIVPADAFVS